jgi:hypothetical protein
VHADRTLESASNSKAPSVVEDDEDAMAASHEMAHLIARDGGRSVDLHHPDRAQAVENDRERLSEDHLAQSRDDASGVALRVCGDDVSSIDDRRARAATKRHSLAIEHPDGRRSNWSSYS